jgi:6-phosphofructokinase 1
MLINNVAIMTSGGDVPGLNPCIRALTLMLFQQSKKVFGVRRGNEGLIDGDIVELNPMMVEDIINKGGTILKSSRSERFKALEYRQKAFASLKNAYIDLLITIGGDGSLTGMKNFSQEFDIPVLGIPKTIDNDILGTDYAIGFDTSLNNAMSSIEKIRDTAESHDRIYFVEIMGRDAGYLTLSAALTTGATDIFIPEIKSDKQSLIDKLTGFQEKGTQPMIVLVAEGDESLGAASLCKEMKSIFPALNMTYTILGHIQRGGSPTAFDRILAIRFANKIVENINQGVFNVMVGIQKNEIVNVDLQDIGNKHIESNNEFIQIHKRIGNIF